MSDENGEHGVTHLMVPTMTITVDPRTMRVTYKCAAAPIFFWQMVVTEVSRQLEEERRAAVAIALQQRVAQDAADAKLAELVKNHPRGVQG